MNFIHTYIHTGLADSIIVAKVVYTNPSSRGDGDDNIVACDEDDEAAAESESPWPVYQIYVCIYAGHKS